MTRRPPDPAAARPAPNHPGEISHSSQGSLTSRSSYEPMLTCMATMPLPSDVTARPAPEGAAVRSGASRWSKVVGALGLVIVVWVGGDLYEIVTSDGNASGGEHGPTRDEPSGTPSGDDEQAPAGGNQHDPSQSDHG